MSSLGISACEWNSLRRGIKDKKILRLFSLFSARISFDYGNIPRRLSVRNRLVVIPAPDLDIRG